MFEDRKDAGQKLAKALEKYKNQSVVILAIPRGGVEVGYQVAKYLKADFSILISRKLPYPYEPEAGFGAIAEDGSTYFIEGAWQQLPDEVIERIKNEHIVEIKRRVEILRKGDPLPDLEKKTVILVDDGIAMGSTMRAAVQLCQNIRAGKIVVAVPVTGIVTAREIRKIVDELVILEKPKFFQAVAQVYRNWYDVSDQEVIGILKKWSEEENESDI